MKKLLFKLFSLLFLFFLLGCEKDTETQTDEDDTKPTTKVQDKYFPTTVGAKWKYKKTYNKPDERVEFIYLELLSFDPASHIYKLSAKTYNKKILVYGSQDGMHDSIVYEDQEKFLFLRNHGTILQMKTATTDPWVICFDISGKESYFFNSFFIKTQVQSSSCITSFEKGYYINMIPWNAMGTFDCYKSGGFESYFSGTQQRTNNEYFSLNFGYIEGFSQYYNHIEGNDPYYPSKTETETEHIELTGYKIGNNTKGENVDEIVYTVIYEY